VGVAGAFRREIKVRPGNMIRVELEQLGRRLHVGIQDLDTTHFEVVSVRTSGPPGKPGLVGGPEEDVADKSDEEGEIGPSIFLQQTLGRRRQRTPFG
jgi:hypothetical protein